MSVLLTGFAPNDAGVNASMILVKSIQATPPDPIASLKDRIHCLILPAATDRLHQSLLAAIAERNYRYCLLVGQAPGRNALTLERIATNLRDFRTPDGEGNRPQGELIEHLGPAAYWSTLPGASRLIETLREHGIPAALSNSAGTHLCNQALYHALHYSATTGSPMKAGLVHIPLLPEQIDGRCRVEPFMTLEMLRESLSVIFTHLFSFSAGERE